MKLKETRFAQCSIIRKPLRTAYYAYWNFLARHLCDEAYLKLKFKKRHPGKKLNLDHPVLFQEKLHWIKIHDRKEMYHKMVDKYEAKEFIKTTLGCDYSIPTLAVYDNYEEIDFEKLPNQFVLKCTFDSGSYYICKDKSKLDRNEVKRRLSSNWDDDYYIWSREWPYHGLKHRIIAEPLIADPNSSELKEFKVFCFNGEPRMYQTCMDRDRINGAILDFFDVDGNHLDLQDGEHCRRSEEVIKPQNLQLLLDISRKLSKQTYFLRVDFFEVNGRIYTGEMTFFENGGFCWFVPEHWNKDLGDWLKLPTDK